MTKAAEKSQTKAIKAGASCRSSSEAACTGPYDSERQHGTLTKTAENPQLDQAFNKDYRFWMVMLTLAFAVMLVSLESTVVITSLPTIVAELGVGSNYVWVTNVFFLTSAAVQPLFSQLCNLFGRKSVLVFVFAAYTLGSGIAGGANEEVMLIAGRTIQGVGSGGLNMASQVIVADLVPLRYRGNYIAMLLVVATVGFSIGPFVGGIIVENTTWRWVFYLNLPIGGVGTVVTYLFINLRWDRKESISAKLKRIDYVGNFTLIISTVSILIALTWAGPKYPWSDVHILTPLLVGVAGLFGFAVYEASGLPAEPVMPLRLFPNWTSRIVYANTFLNNVLMFCCLFFLPLYFQSVLLSSPSRSGVQMLPLTLIVIPGAALSAWLLSRFGKYKYLHLAGYVLMTAGVGSLAALEKDSTTVEWVFIQVVPSLGSGFVLNSLLPAFQASLSEQDQAAATGTWFFIRTFGQIWGVAIGGAVFNSFIRQYSHIVDDPRVRGIVSNGDAYASATREFVMQFEGALREQVRDVFLLALRRVYILSMAFGGLAMLFAFFERDIPLRTALDTAYGLEKKQKSGEEETG